MASRPNNKMSIQDRAKQFMPFAALKGLPEALAAKEKIVVSKIEMSPEMAEELDRKMHLLKRGRIATVIYFHQGEYLKLTGMVARIDPTCRLLQIVNTKISFEDILDITFPPD
ncbi:MAG: YolD-like family protein [Lachnospiraceae bacterium]